MKHVPLSCGLQRMTALCKSRLLDGAAERLNTSDEACKSWGAEFGAKMCQRCVEGGAPGLHFYTLNLEKVVLGVLVKMGLITAEQQAQCSAGEADAKLMISARRMTVDKLLQLQTERQKDGDVLSGPPSKRQCQTPPRPHVPTQCMFSSDSTTRLAINYNPDPIVEERLHGAVLSLLTSL